VKMRTRGMASQRTSSAAHPSCRPDCVGANKLAIVMFVVAMAAAAAAQAPAAAGALTLADAEQMLVERSLAVAQTRYQLDAAKALRLIAGYKPNPTV
jgi:hypothetical protein